MPLETPDAAETVSEPTRLDARVTVFPATGLLEGASRKVTVTVEVVDPSAGTVRGAAVTSELVALGGFVTAASGSMSDAARAMSLMRASST